MSVPSGSHPVELLSAFIDGELSTEEQRLLNRHLGDCLPCARLLRDMQALSRAAAEEEAPPLPVDLEARVRARLAPVAAHSAVRGVRTGWGFRLPVAAAAAVAAGLALWVAARGFRGPSPVGENVAPQAGITAPLETRTHDDETGPPAAESVVEEESPSGVPPAESFSPSPPPGIAPQRETKQAAGSATDSRAKERQSAESMEARPGVAAKSDDTTARPEPSAKDAAAPAASTSLMAITPVESDRRLALRQSDGLTITLLESGHLRVEGPDYGCSVSLGETSRPAERPEIVTRLFLAADSAARDSGKDVQLEGKVAQPPPGGGTAEGQAAKGAVTGGAPPGGESLSLTSSNGTTLLLAAPAIIDDLRRLALGTYRGRLEETCGPLPGIGDP